jgi:hypothetical protein
MSDSVYGMELVIEAQRKEIERLRAAMTTARALIGAINDHAPAAVKASNTNQAWHVLNDNLRSCEQNTRDSGGTTALAGAGDGNKPLSPPAPKSRS